MSHAAILVHPVCALFTTIEFGILKHGFSMLPADGIGNLPQTVVVRNMVFKLSAGAEGYGVHYNMVVDIIRV